MLYWSDYSVLPLMLVYLHSEITLYTRPALPWSLHPPCLRYDNSADARTVSRGGLGVVGYLVVT